MFVKNLFWLQNKVFGFKNDILNSQNTKPKTPQIYQTHNIHLLLLLLLLLLWHLLSKNEKKKEKERKNQGMNGSNLDAWFYFYETVSNHFPNDIIIIHFKCFELLV